MEVVIVTGLSGAGKTQAIKIFEDIGYFCVDNMLPELFGQFVKIYMQRQTNIKNIAVGIDARSGENFEQVFEIISAHNANVDYKILFLNADNDVLIARFKESRKSHPLSRTGRIEDGISKERTRLKKLFEKSDYVINTSNLENKDLKQEIMDIFKKQNQENMTINIVSFGFKYGVPNDVDLVFDVRFLPNPFYINELKDKTGNDKEVKDYVLNKKEAKEFMQKLIDMLDFLIPNYKKEGKARFSYRNRMHWWTTQVCKHCPWII